MPSHRQQQQQQQQQQEEEDKRSAFSADEDTSTSYDCRVCFCNESLKGNPLLHNVCSCSGTSSYIHLECLGKWREALRLQGNWKKANRCEVCQAPWNHKVIARAQRQAGHRSLWLQPRRLLSMCSRRLLLMADSPSWSLLTWRLWRAYIFCAGLYSACISGMQGLRAGIKVGRSLVEEQSGVLIHLLTALADLLGTPATELLWIQVVAGVVFALASEFLYSALLGCFGGAVLGFCTGYVGAIRGSFKVLLGGVSKVAQGSRGIIRFALLGLGARKMRTVL
mmetsp:Transcript_5913/g.15731  ORF Transcript_5913/g.15731 Transcript_5913/m.15731 type:complete len:280 (+) Transcript_5913:115-954(+)